VPARIYAIANQKGGVGKTTTAVNLAACLAEAGERCLIVDLDPQANATSGLGLRANGHSTLDLLDGTPLRELVDPGPVANPDVVPAKAELAAATVHLSALEGGERYLSDALHDEATGPYRFVEWSRGQRLVVEASPSYWGSQPAVKTLVFRPIPEVATAIAEMMAGSVDFIRLVPPDQIPAIEGSGKAYITTAPIIRVIFINFDVAGRAGAGPTQNIKVREAISHAIDVDGIITHVLGGRGLKLGTVVNPMKFGYDPSIKPVPYDPAKSKQLLAEAGVAPGTKLEFMTYSGSVIASRQVGDAVSGYLNKVGLQTNHQHIEDIGLSSNLERTGKLKDIYLASWGSWSVFDADMILYPRFHSSEAFAYVRDPKLDEWLDVGRNTVNAGKRMEAYRQVQKYVADNYLVFPMYAQTSVMAVSNKLNYKAASDETIALWRATWKN